MLDRRKVLGAALLSPFSLLATRALQAQEKLDFTAADPYSFEVGTSMPTLDEYEKAQYALTGPDNPFKAERATAKRLLEDIPRDARPYDIAMRFHLWRTGRVPNKTAAELAEYSYYSREWPIRGNPVTMGFFDATGLREISGDVTFWCAAFVCWCIQRSQEGRGVTEKVWPYDNGAASAAFRDWGKDVEKDLKDTPRQGDLVVLKNTSKPSSGHVTFLHSIIDDDTILGLGGNQGAQNERNGDEVNIAAFSRSAKNLKIISFRRHPALE